MAVLDLTLAIPPTEAQRERHDAPPRMTPTHQLCEYRALGPGGDRSRVAHVYRFSNWSMSGTYMDLPGHLAMTNDGQDMAGIAVQRLFRVPATLLRIDPAIQQGAVTPEHLRAAAKHTQPGGAVVIHALGARRHDQIPFRSAWLSAQAVQWIIDLKVHLVISDIYESANDFQDVFQRFFAAGVTTVCAPDHLHSLSQRELKITALPLRFERVTQAPCRLIAEWHDSSLAGGQVAGVLGDAADAGQGVTLKVPQWEQWQDDH